MALDKIQFQTNVAQELALKYDGDGKRCEGRFGDQIYYTVVDASGRDMGVYVEPIVDQRLKDLGLRRGERFSLGRFEVKDGQRKRLEWRVARVDPPRQPVTVTRPATPPTRPAAAPAPAPAPPPSAAPAVNRPIAATMLADAIRTAIQAARDGEAYGDEIGYPVRFGPEHIKSMALTVLINGSGRQNGGHAC